MKLKDVKSKLKKGKAGSLWIKLYRKIGIVFTWIIINIFPKINPNLVTSSMLILNVISAVLLFYGIVQSSWLFILFAIITLFISKILDCVDGNLARIQNRTSIIGVYLDRIVHNVTHPLIFIMVGYAIYMVDSNIIHLSILIFTGIFIELNPLEIAVKDTKLSLIYKKINNSTEMKIVKPERFNRVTNPIRGTKNLIIEGMKFIFSFEILYFIILVDLIIDAKFSIIIVYVAIYGLMHLVKGFDYREIVKFSEVIN